MSDRITIRRPDDFHVHGRSGAMLRLVAPETARQFGRALFMPNVPEIRAGAEAAAYRDEIRAATAGFGFEPLMTIKLTPQTTPAWIAAAHDDGVVAAKLYPDGVTTGSQGGIRDIWPLAPIFAAMADRGMVLCIHAEHPDSWVLWREIEYLPQVHWIAENYPSLRIVVEHISNARTVDFVGSAEGAVAATITPHHLIVSIDDVLDGGGPDGRRGLRPHLYCKPVPKSAFDRDELVKAAVSGNPKFFAGTDSAPHPRTAKESACGCAGVYCAPVAMPVYAQIFEQHGGPDWVHKLEDFTGRFGAEFYGLLPNEGTIALERPEGGWKVPDRAEGEGAEVVPFLAGQTLPWRVAR